MTSWHTLTSLPSFSVAPVVTLYHARATSGGGGAGEGGSAGEGGGAEGEGGDGLGGMTGGLRGGELVILIPLDTPSTKGMLVAYLLSVTSAP